MLELDKINVMVDGIANRRAARKLVLATATALDELDSTLSLALRDLVDDDGDETPAPNRLLKKKQKARAKAKPAADDDEEEDEDVDEPDAGGGADEKTLCDICGETALRTDNKTGVCSKYKCQQAAKAKKA